MAFGGSYFLALLSCALILLISVGLTRGCSCLLPGIAHSRRHISIQAEIGPRRQRMIAHNVVEQQLAVALAGPQLVTWSTASNLGMMPLKHVGS